MCGSWKGWPFWRGKSKEGNYYWSSYPRRALTTTHFLLKEHWKRFLSDNQNPPAKLCWRIPMIPSPAPLYTLGSHSAQSRTRAWPLSPWPSPLGGPSSVRVRSLLPHWPLCPLETSKLKCSAWKAFLWQTSNEPSYSPHGPSRALTIPTTSCMAPQTQWGDKGSYPPLHWTSMVSTLPAPTELQ